ncbi:MULTISPECIES: FAD-dependent oxidoreductase [Thermoanaerobacterium]|uniref:2,4-dienoyl-CoA reductase-like NADH-dependent reductase (Old Yellow Enzyme family)/thioredoxin reductase n=1 Tax=Thermoanaerobacterium butyriciformans TaxID=1702242 RepID=A0ABS4NGY5_9THEO|nr:FAD-dependent oxidoreductase [Thermoanaerobacterium butyriciformans]MBP2072265.1 2,4-dienoyl-CoA reductase-like NADH-dependent reductase (Old Yellow Enzyme family)/thioredoxin reductase [Thermoanaerobacterium butyriciformans]WHE08343.1 FAD-dependent oxidoreductase [Thermoanaerobacterium thermosaccharolyticum]
MFDGLLSKGKIGTMETRNRIVMTAMGNALANNDGTVSQRDINFYGARAKGGVGLIITECTIVDERGKGNTKQICVYDDRFIPGLKALAEEVHKYDGKIVVQIYHPGRQGISAINGNLPMMAPSDVECKVVRQPVQAMSIQQIEEMVNKFVDAAVRIKNAGIDGVEVHGAHGYLINQFLSPYTNKRTDKYGGNLENRMRFLEEIVVGIKEKCGKDFPLLVRLSVDEFLEMVGLPNEGLHIDESVKIAKRLEELGVDALDISCGIYETMNVAWEPSSYEQGWKVHLAETIKKSVNIPVIGVSVYRDPEFANRMIEEGKIDFVGSARQHFADPEWANKAKEGKLDEIRKCISCLYCMESLMSADITGASAQCSINIQSGREGELNDFKEDGAKRVVAIIGAGPAGLEAARILAKRRFKPLIFEKSDKLGGQLQFANKPPKKEKINWLIDYLKTQIEKAGIEVRYNTAPTVEILKKLNPYAIFLAQGSNPIMPKSIRGIDRKNVLVAEDILSGKVRLNGKKVAVVGSGMTGLETAHYLAVDGNDVSVFEMADEIGPGLFFQNLIDILGHLGPFKVKLYPKHKLVEIGEDKVIFENTETKENIYQVFDYVVLSLGRTPNTELIDEIKAAFDNVVVLGDAKQAGKIRNAMESGFMAAYNL